MPNILIHLPAGAYPDASRQDLVRHINEAAALAEQLPEHPRHRAMCWVLVQELSAGQWTCGGQDVTDRVLPCMARVSVPAGVLDDASRALYVKAMQHAFEQALPAGEQRVLQLSVILEEVPDGFWGVNQQLWRLPDFALAAGFKHLQKSGPGEGPSAQR